MDTPIRGTLRSCSLFMRLPDGALATLERIAETRRFRKGQLVLREGQHPPGVFVVRSGLVKIFKLGVNGKEHVLHLAQPGQSFAEVAVMGEFPVPAFAEALEETACVFLPRSELLATLDSDARLSRLVLAGMAMRARALIGMLEDLVLRDATARVARYLLNEADRTDGIVRLPGLKKHVASHLNLTSETLSRTLRRLTDAGILGEEPRAALRVLDRPALRRAAASDYPEL